MSISHILAGRIQGLRLKAGFKQEDEAHRLGITRAALSHYESARRQPDYDTLVVIANLHNVSIDYLLGREDERMPKEPVNEYLTIEPTTEECFNDDCCVVIRPGDAAYKVGQDICCSLSCAEKVRKEIKIERFII